MTGGITGHVSIRLWKLHSSWPTSLPAQSVAGSNERRSSSGIQCRQMRACSYISFTGFVSQIWLLLNWRQWCSSASARLLLDNYHSNHLVDLEHTVIDMWLTMALEAWRQDSICVQAWRQSPRASATPATCCDTSISRVPTLLVTIN